MRNNKKIRGFTLIELVAVLVIIAILALIVTPLVLNIIRKARTAADKRSIDAYGRSIELAIAGYLLDNGTFPTSIEQLTIEYSGGEVVCSTTQLNPDSSVYLTGCTVGGRSVDYAYGSDKSPTYTAYTVGNQVTYNNVDYYVIADSGTSESTVTLLKAEPLSVAEVNQYGVGHINRYTSGSVGTASNQNGYGGMAYYSSTTCGWSGSDWVFDGCTTNYAQSEIKYVVDAWKTAKAPAATEARLITKDEYESMTTIETYETPTEPGKMYVPIYDWQYNSSYWYWTNTPYEDSSSYVWNVGINCNLSFGIVLHNGGVVRPVITISKSVISSTEN